LNLHLTDAPLAGVASAMVRITNSAWSLLPS